LVFVDENIVIASPPKAGVAIAGGPAEIATLGHTASLAMTSQTRRAAYCQREWLGVSR
jgi:hypothetical protein